MKWITTILATISVLFDNQSTKIEVPVSLNSAIIAYTETYYAPAVADPDNFPYAKAVQFVATEKPKKEPPKKETKPVTPVPVPQLIQQTLPPVLPPPPLPASPAPVGDPYIALIEPVTPWLRMDFTFGGHGFETPQPREFSIIKIDREYWKIEVFAYWAVDITPLKPPVENDYFKLEVYEKQANKLIYTMTSGKEESFHKFQVFKKPGEYYFKTYTKPIMKYEINLFVSPKIAQ